MYSEGRGTDTGAKRLGAENDDEDDAAEEDDTDEAEDEEDDAEDEDAEDAEDDEAGAASGAVSGAEPDAASPEEDSMRVGRSGTVIAAVIDVVIALCTLRIIA